MAHPLRPTVIFTLALVVSCTASHDAETHPAPGQTAPAGAPAAQNAPPVISGPAPSNVPQAIEKALAPGDAAARAKVVFQQRCVLCHGAGGKGDGITAASLSPRPRDYTTADWQASVTDAYIHRIIVEGGEAVGKSMMMPPNPDLAKSPEVVDEIVKIVRSFDRRRK